MLVQKPHDYVLKEMGAPALIRRHYYNEIKKTKIEKKNGAQDKKAYMETFEKIYALAKEYKDSTFYDSVNQLLDLKSYFRWMAFNYYVCNGDYTDELYFYALSDDLDIRFGILPWDYDDIFALEPHEGEFVRNRLIGDRLLFSAEDALDRGLARNDKAYSQYLKELAGLMLEMDMESVMEVYEETFRELYPYYADKNIIATSRLDPFGEVGSEGLKKALLESYELLLSRHEAIEHALEEENK